MTVAELQVLEVLIKAKGNFVKPGKLRKQTGLSDDDLQGAVASLKNQGYADWVDGGELAGKAIRFYETIVTDEGVTAFAKNKPAENNITEAQRRQIENEFIAQVNDKAEDYKDNGDDDLVALGKAFRDISLLRPTKANNL